MASVDEVRDAAQRGAERALAGAMREMVRVLPETAIAVIRSIEPISRAAMIYELTLTEDSANHLQRCLQGYGQPIVGEDREPAEETLAAMRHRVREIRAALWPIEGDTR